MHKRCRKVDYYVNCIYVIIFALLHLWGTNYCSLFSIIIVGYAEAQCGWLVVSDPLE